MYISYVYLPAFPSSYCTQCICCPLRNSSLLSRFLPFICLREVWFNRYSVRQRGFHRMFFDHQVENCKTLITIVIITVYVAVSFQTLRCGSERQGTEVLHSANCIVPQTKGHYSSRCDSLVKLLLIVLNFPPCQLFFDSLFEKLIMLKERCQKSHNKLC